MLAHDPRKTRDQRLLRIPDLRLDAMALERVDVEVRALRRGQDGHGSRAAELGQRSVDLVTREQARQVGSKQAAVHAVGNDGCARAEQEVQQADSGLAGIALGGLETEIEALRI